MDGRVGSALLIGGQVNYVAERRRAAGDVRANVPDYATVDLSLRTDAGKKGWSFMGSIRNLFDADAREPTPTPSLSLSIPHDLPLPGRSFYLQAVYKM